MAADKPAKAPPLYEGGPDKSTAVPACFVIAKSAATRQSMDRVAIARNDDGDLE